MNLDHYRDRAKVFIEEIGLEHYRHFAGLQDEFAIEEIYDRHQELFSHQAIEQLHQNFESAQENETRHRLRELLRFGLEGHLGLATKHLDAKIAQ